MGYRPYAYDEKNIAVTGGGILDGGGNCEHWWPWKGAAVCSRAGGTGQKPARDRLFAMAEQGVAVAQRVFGLGSYLRPSFVQPYKCQDVLIEGVTLVDSPMWQMHPVLCTNATVRNATMFSHGPNNDGCDPESCRDVLIEGCTFETGDDCVAIKSGRNADGRRVHVTSENIIVRRCTMRDGHGGVTIGSEISGGVRRVFVERCTMSSPHLERALRIKTNAMRGGTIEQGRFLPTVREVDVRNVTSRKSTYGLYLRGFAAAPITDVRIRDCRFDGVAKPDVVQHVKGLSISNVTVNGQRSCS